MSETTHIVCPHCLTVNRLPTARLADRPNCGRCRKPLFEGHPIALSAADFDLFAARSDIPLLVDFWAPWCGPCRMMAPAFEQAAGQLEPRFRLAKVNTEEEPALASRFGIRSIPTLVLFHRGREVARQAGAMGARDIVRWALSQVGR
jgi:thioredoxin 2